MKRHFHGHGHGPALVPSLTVPAEAIPLTVPAEPDFSQFFQSGVHCAVIERMRRSGLMCDADIAGLRPDELVTAMSGFIDDEEAGWYIELARGALAFLARRASGAPQCARPVEGLPVPAVKRCRLVGSIAPGAFQWSQNALTALRPVHQHSEMVHACWEIYAALGTHGELWSPLLEEHQAIAREGLASRLQIFERRTLQAQLSALRRWANYVLQFGKGPAEVLLPPVALLFSFLKQASDGGPTAAQGLFQKLLWWRRHVGIPFPLGDPMVATWNRVAEGHSIQPRVPLSFRAFQALCKLALGGSMNVATFASLALIPLVACLRFAHAQRSADWTLSHDFARAVCLKGKSRKHGTRPSFEWAAPMHVGKWKHVLGLASRVIIDLRSQVPDLSFCIPDVACGPSGCLDERAHWRAAPMPMARFVKLLHSVLRSEGLPDAEVGLISTYSLRRFLPSVAEVLRTPVEVAQHLGNWTESVTTKHAQPMPVQMSQHYAHDRVLSAGHTKALLCAAVQELLETESGPLDWQSFRTKGLSWQQILNRHSALTPPADKPVNCQGSDSEASSDETSSSSDGGSSHEGLPHDLEWFRFARGVSHIARERSQSQPVPWCRGTPFAGIPLEWGIGIEPGLQICAKCQACVPPHIKRAIDSCK